MPAGQPRQTLSIGFESLIFVGFILITIASYLIYEVILRDLPAHTFVLSTFATLFVWYALSDRARPLLWNMRPEISKYVVWFSFFVFAYWYAFWVGLKAAKSADLALAFLALTIVISPLIAHFACEHDRIQARFEFGVTSALLLVGIIFVKLNLERNEFTFHDMLKKATTIEWYSVVCFLVAVLAEAGQEATSRRLYEAVVTNKINCYNNIEGGHAAAKTDIASTELIVGSLPLCFALAFLMFVIHSDLPGTNQNEYGLFTYLWFGGWLFILGLAGTLYRNEVIYKYKVSHGLQTGKIGPWIALRLVIYLPIAAGLALLMEKLIDQSRCAPTKCWFTLIGSPISLHIDFVPEPKFTYYLGALMIVIAFLIRVTRPWRGTGHSRSNE